MTKMKKRKYKCTREHKNITILTESSFYNIMKTIEHITFYITNRALTDH